MFVIITCRNCRFRECRCDLHAGSVRDTADSMTYIPDNNPVWSQLKQITEERKHDRNHSRGH